MVASTPCDRSPCKFNVPYSRRDACGCSPSVPQFSVAILDIPATGFIGHGIQIGNWFPQSLHPNHG